MVTIAWAAASAGCDGQDAGDDAGRTSTEPPTLSQPSVALPVTPGSEVHPPTPTVTVSTADTSVSLRENVGGATRVAGPRENVGGATRAAGPPATRPDAFSRSTSYEGAPVTERDLAALAAGLVVPVTGVARSALRDSYTEARGAGGERAHEAIDIMAARGTPVLAATDGRLLKLFNSRPGGLMIYTTDASERFILFYGHLDGYAAGLTDGMRLTRGQVIGYVGTTGNAAPDAPHLHFGILRGNPAVSWSEGTPVNPYPLLAPK
jgi:murein DD-endopeptidase MepM/ murein hydrolase activator NlpD